MDDQRAGRIVVIEQRLWPAREDRAELEAAQVRLGWFGAPYMQALARHRDRPIAGYLAGSGSLPAAARSSSEWATRARIVAHLLVANLRRPRQER
jgi:hypothetical protein